MSFSTTATKQRQQEAKSVKSFLTVSVIGSLAVHIGVLTYGLNNLLSVAPPKKDKPIEITFVEPQTEVTPKTPQPKKKEKQSIPFQVSKTQPSAKQVENQERISPQRSLAPTPQTPQTQSQAAEQPKAPAANPQTTIAPTEPTNTAPSPTNVSPASPSVLTGNAIDSSVVFDAKAGSNSEQSNTAGSRRSKRETVATGSTTPQAPTEIRGTNRESSNTGNGDGRAACSECDTNYPEQARRNGVEGRVEVAVDTDTEGNVTNVRIVRSSGNRDLDEATLEQAREWKLKRSASGRQNTRIATEYAIEGSQRHRELQEQRSQQRQATAVPPGRTRRQMQTATNQNNTSPPKRQSVATSSKKPTSTNATGSNQPSRPSSQSRVATQKPSTSSTSRRQQSATQPSGRVRRTNVATGPVRNSSSTPTRRTRRQNVVVNRNRVTTPTTRQRESSTTNNRRVRRQRSLSAPVAPKK
jgi:TonB family protein